MRRVEVGRRSCCGLEAVGGQVCSCCSCCSAVLAVAVEAAAAADTVAADVADVAGIAVVEGSCHIEAVVRALEGRGMRRRRASRGHFVRKGASNGRLVAEIEWVLEAGVCCRSSRFAGVLRALLLPVLVRRVYRASAKSRMTRVGRGETYAGKASGLPLYRPLYAILPGVLEEIAQV